MKQVLLKVLAALLIGIILGGSGMNLYISQQFEELVAKNKTLEAELSNTLKNLNDLKERTKQQQTNKVITDINANVKLIENDQSPSFESASAKLDAERKIKKILLPLKGQEVKDINYNLIPRIVDGREFESEGRRYVLKVDLVVAADELNIYATAEKMKQKEN
ncbi:hypothetical protein M1N64_03375 [Peptococcaceae bacterium]|nr:hypothetical protein [Peptococcaceae bacterium]